MASIAVIIPCYKVKAHILEVLQRIGPEVRRVYVVDDCCPEGSGDLVEQECTDSRVRVVRHQINQGVGGAVMTGYRVALDDGMDIMVKIDGDGQMAPELLPDFVAPILAGEADYTKGNRFFDLEQVSQMPTVRLLGNAVLSFFNKISSGYWNLFDPTNGYTAIHRDVAACLPFGRISRRYFFESDMLFRLNTLRAVVVDIPMHASYGDEVSNLRISKVVGEFFFKHVRNTFKRIFYNYYLRDLSLASLQLPMGMLLLIFGVLFGLYKWNEASSLGVTATPGTVMLSALPVLVSGRAVGAAAAVPAHVAHAGAIQEPVGLGDAGDRGTPDGNAHADHAGRDGDQLACRHRVGRAGRRERIGRITGAAFMTRARASRENNRW